MHMLAQESGKAPRQQPAASTGGMRGAQTSSAVAINDSPRMLAQRRQIDALFGRAASHHAAVLQRAGELVPSGDGDETLSEDVGHYVRLFEAQAHGAARRKLFIGLSRQLHPDKNKAPGATDAFSAMNRAYKIVNGQAQAAEADDTPAMPALEGPAEPLMIEEGLPDRIQEEFSELLYIRKTRRIEDEIKFILSDRVKFYLSGEAAIQEEIDKNYWHAAFTVLDGLPVKVYDSFKSSGLVISARTAEMVGWGKVDMGLPTKAVPRATYPAGFPQRASARGGKTLNTVAGVSGKLKEIRARVRGERPDVSTSGRARAGGTHRADFGLGLEETYMPKAPYAGATEIPYGEAQIHYKPSDVLGVYIERDDLDAIRQALELRTRLKSLMGRDLPLVEYAGGGITIHRSAADFLRELASANPALHAQL